ncbi:MAG: aldo/keto reductase, partial [Candidatus Thorarchaeota archaeon]
EELFITSKVWNSEQGYEKTIKAYDQSLKRLGLDYLDLYLIHWPIGKNDETWPALETLYKEGKIKAIGVSNFMVNDLDGLLPNHQVTPAVNQIIMHPLKYKENKKVAEYSENKNIKIEAYSPLIHGYKLDKEDFKEIANKYNKSVPQILIRWSLQHGFICIPRSSNRDHIKQNANVFDFELSQSDMTRLNSF